MKFGQVDNPEHIDFTLPNDHSDTTILLNSLGKEEFKAYVGGAKWNRQDLKNFYPRGTKDDLAYYSTQFNSIELNATFYRIFPPEQFEKWQNRTENDFKFFPKISRDISHYKQLKDVEEVVDRYLFAVSHLGNKLGTVFLQMHDRFSPKSFKKLQTFVELWPHDLPLTIELRQEDWFSDEVIANELASVLRERAIAHTLVDTPGRRDLLHMRLTAPAPFVRWVSSYHHKDISRLDDWINRIVAWREQGLNEIQFFIHQDLSYPGPLLSAYFIKQLNERLGCNMAIPQKLDSETNQNSLF